MTDKTEDMIIGEALAGLKTHSGYKALINEIIYPLYEQACMELEERESAESRAMILAIKTIVARIDDSINLGKQARDEYKETLAQHMQSTD